MAEKKNPEEELIPADSETGEWLSSVKSFTSEEALINPGEVPEDLQTDTLKNLGKVSPREFPYRPRAKMSDKEWAKRKKKMRTQKNSRRANR